MSQRQPARRGGRFRPFLSYGIARVAQIFRMVQRDVCYDGDRRREDVLPHPTARLTRLPKSPTHTARSAKSRAAANVVSSKYVNGTGISAAAALLTSATPPTFLPPPPVRRQRVSARQNPEEAAKYKQPTRPAARQQKRLQHGANRTLAVCAADRQQRHPQR